MGAVMAEGSNATLVVRAPVPADSRISIVHEGRTVASVRGGELRYAVTGGRGAYRAEILVPGAPGQPPAPWIVSNPIYFGVGSGEAGQPATAATADPVPAAANSPPFPWRIEKDPSSSGTLRTGPTDAALEYKLGEGAADDQFVALASDLADASFSAIQLSLAADRPMRISVQLRSGDGRRWGRSYYVDPAGSRVTVPVSSLTPIGKPFGPVQDPTSLLLVVDLTNARPGRSGMLRVLASAILR
jgi:hypothetical protein